MRPLRATAAIVLALAVIATGTGFSGPAAFSVGDAPSWQLSDTGTTARFRGLAPVSDKVAWVAGSAGTILRTTDGGDSWQSVGPASAAELQFRDIEAFDAQNAVALTIGEGTDSRLYTTRNGGRTWTETFRNDEPTAFYDCFAFLTRRHGIALSDPVGGKFRILETRDGGWSWSVADPAGMPAALAGEFAFAASGTCLVTPKRSDGRTAWFATGGGSSARVFHTVNAGRTWSVVDSPIPSGPSAGIYSLAFRDTSSGLAVGGDYATPEVAPDGSAFSRDGGRTWAVSKSVPGEYRSGADWLGYGSVALAVGPTGSDLSWNGGRDWSEFDGGSFDAVICAADRSCWASGEQGRVAKLQW